VPRAHFKYKEGVHNYSKDEGRPLGRHQNHNLKIFKERIKNHPRKEVKIANLKGLSEIVFGLILMAPLG
jgi:hypothetical protein